MNIFDVHHAFLELWGYQMSYLELVGTITGLAAVLLSAMANTWNWPIGLINVITSFFLFYKVQLYPDMMLQVFFFWTNIIGWWRWTHPPLAQEDDSHELKVSFMTVRQWITLISIGTVGTFLMGIFAQNLHHLLPWLFSKPSARPFMDSFITVMSITTTFYVIQKKIESWISWIIVDALATYLYFIRDIKVYSFMYLVFCILAAIGLWNWLRLYKTYRLSDSTESVDN